jgi:hypothetical protein
VVSVIPTTVVKADDVIKIDTQEGTIYKAQAGLSGDSMIDAEINGDEEKVYYVSNGKYTALDGVETGDDLGGFAGKTLDFTIASDDQKYVDMFTGKIYDGDIWTDCFDNSAVLLKNKIKHDTEKRYNESETNTSKSIGFSNLIPFTWFETSYKSADTNANGGADSLNVYSDLDGNYIDGDYNLGKIIVKTTDGAVTIQNTNDKYNLNTINNAVYASVNEEKIIGKDDNYIYRLAKITIDSNAAIEKINDVNLSDIDSDSAFTGANTNEVTYEAIQKISLEAASDDIDGAKYAKTVTTYALSDKDGQALKGFDGVDFTDLNYSVKDGKFVAYHVNSEVVDARYYTLASNYGYTYADEGDLSSEYATLDADGNAMAASTDDTLWRVCGEYIYKFDADGWHKIYKVDAGLNKWSFINGTNIVLWNEDANVYSIISPKDQAVGVKDTATTTTTESTATTTAAVTVTTTGWTKNTDGTWSYVKADGTKATGWLKDGGTWYYLKADCVMATGWVNDNGTWYYCNESGAMLANTTIDGYVLGDNGVWVG